MRNHAFWAVLSPKFRDKRHAVGFWHHLLKSLWQNKELTRRLCSSQCEGVLYLTMMSPDYCPVMTPSANHVNIHL